MTDTNQLFDHSELSLASYANLSTGKTIDQITALEQKGMSTYQAQMFAARWTDVIEQYTNPITGFSATAFRNGTEVCIAIAGTDSLTDLFIIDAAVAVGLGAPGQYDDLKTFYASLLSSNSITATDTLTASGHSLGGFLAQMFSVDYATEVSHTYTYNAPGIGGAVAEMLDLMGVTETNIPTSSITNMYGDGFSTTAGLGTVLGSTQKVQIENNFIWTLGDHSIIKLTDSLAAYNTLWQLDQSLSVETFNEFFKQSSNEEDASLERVMDGLQAVFGLGTDELLIDDRESFYHAISLLQDDADYEALKDHITLDTNLGSGRSDFGSFLSLYNLTPFVLHCDATATTALKNANSSLASDWEADQSLPDAERTFSDQYLTDRATAFGVLNTRNRLDNDATAPGIRYNDTVYFDYETEKEFFYDGGNNSINSSSYTNKTQIHFGSDDPETLTGGDKADHLYGGAGTDTLNGGKGNDYIEGGKGNDTLDGGEGVDTLIGGKGNDIYNFSTTGGFGNDTISDTDDSDTDTININGATLTAKRMDKVVGGNWDGTYLFLDGEGKAVGAPLAAPDISYIKEAA